MKDWHLHASFKICKEPWGVCLCTTCIILTNFKICKDIPRVCFASRLQNKVLNYVMRVGECILTLTCYLKYAKALQGCVLHKRPTYMYFKICNASRRVCLDFQYMNLHLKTTFLFSKINTSMFVPLKNTFFPKLSRSSHFMA